MPKWSSQSWQAVSLWQGREEVNCRLHLNSTGALIAGIIMVMLAGVIAERTLAISRLFAAALCFIWQCSGWIVILSHRSVGPGLLSNRQSWTPKPLRQKFYVGFIFLWQSWAEHLLLCPVISTLSVKSLEEFKLKSFPSSSFWSVQESLAKTNIFFVG